MSTYDVRSLGRFGPYLVAVPFLTVIFGFYGTFLPFGVLGMLGMALGGLLWALVLGFIAGRLARRESWRARLANASLFVGIIAVGLTIGGGFMYASMMDGPGRAVDHVRRSVGTRAAAVPYFIILTTMELLLVPLLVFWNWNIGPRRKALVLIGVAAYLAMRVWTYLVFAEMRLDISQQTLSAADVARTDARHRFPDRTERHHVHLLPPGRVRACTPPTLLRKTADAQWTVPRWLPQLR